MMALLENYRGYGFIEQTGNRDIDMEYSLS